MAFQPHSSPTETLSSPVNSGRTDVSLGPNSPCHPIPSADRRTDRAPQPNCGATPPRSLQGRISKWDLHLPVLEFAYNNATHAATGQTPFFLCYGRHPLTPQQPNIPATVTPVTFRLRLPATWKIHNAFHVQLLKPYRDPNTIFSGRQPPPPPPVLVHDEPEYEVESVLAHRRRRNGTVELLIRWKGYDPSEDSWL
ncbi:hypothetical protein CLOM_g345 [Closterium sp. NIES-68]|nr:hypothetical protein CLOM_g345 [Closterium sp. NIES-68]